ncbi:hypothetical protein J6590_031023 [Homalodisca vitripennis]|nr:hypothetical protein J6590_031023 [Homalodisca vitripennis]
MSKNWLLEEEIDLYTPNRYHLVSSYCRKPPFIRGPQAWRDKRAEAPTGEISLLIGMYLPIKLYTVTTLWPSHYVLGLRPQASISMDLMVDGRAFHSQEVEDLNDLLMRFIEQGYE